MSILNFKEIPEAHIASGEQDTFELFARDFLEHLGYKIMIGPGRGADGGSDLVVSETRKGVGGETEIRWLVSCKHKAFSGSSVTLSVDGDILDRVNSHSCDGFIGFYSTLPASSLIQKLEGLNNQIEYQIYDAELIEKTLVESPSGLHLAKRYFPDSIGEWMRENPKPAQVIADNTGLQCEYCGKELLEENKGIVVVWEKLVTSESPPDAIRVEDIYWSCKGECDTILRSRYDHKYPNHVDGWDDIPDICIPTVYLKWIISFMNQLYGNYYFSKRAFEKHKILFIEIFPYVSRELTEKEKETLKMLANIPYEMGGMGY